MTSHQDNNQLTVHVLYFSSPPHPPLRCERTWAHLLGSLENGGGLDVLEFVAGGSTAPLDWGGTKCKLCLFACLFFFLAPPICHRINLGCLCLACVTFQRRRQPASVSRSPQLRCKTCKWAQIASARPSPRASERAAVALRRPAPFVVSLPFLQTCTFLIADPLEARRKQALQKNGSRRRPQGCLELANSRMRTCAPHVSSLFVAMAARRRSTSSSVTGAPCCLSSWECTG